MRERERERERRRNYPVLFIYIYIYTNDPNNPHSGTAVILANALQTKQVSEIRAADVKGIHRVDAFAELESIEITHTAHDRFD